MKIFIRDVRRETESSLESTNTRVSSDSRIGGTKGGMRQKNTFEKKQQLPRSLQIARGRDTSRIKIFSNRSDRARLRRLITRTPVLPGRHCRAFLFSVLHSPSLSLSLSLFLSFRASTLPRLRLYLSLHLCLLGRSGAHKPSLSRRRRFSLSRSAPPPPRWRSDERPRRMYRDARSRG